MGSYPPPHGQCTPPLQRAPRQEGTQTALSACDIGNARTPLHCGCLAAGAPPCSAPRPAPPSSSWRHAPCTPCHRTGPQPRCRRPTMRTMGLNTLANKSPSLAPRCTATPPCSTHRIGDGVKGLKVPPHLLVGWIPVRAACAIGVCNTRGKDSIIKHSSRTSTARCLGRSVKTFYSSSG